MYRTLLVPLDGLELAERALSHAKALATAGAGKVVLVQAVTTRAFPGIDDTEAQVKAVEQAEAYLEGVASSLQLEGISVETGVVFDEPSTGIAVEVEIREADLVVMTTHGRSGIGQILHGSVAEAVIHRSRAPILLLQSWIAEAYAPEFVDHPRVLVPLDGSEFAEAVLGPATRFVQQFGGKLLLLQAVSAVDEVVAAMGPGAMLPVVAVAEEVEELEAKARVYLQQRARRLEATLAPERVAWEVRVGEATPAIVDAALDHHVTLIAMSTHGRSAMGQFVFGSVAASVLRQATAPLLLVRPSSLSSSETQPGATITSS